MENKDQTVKLLFFTGKKIEFSVDEFLELIKAPALYTVLLLAIVVDYAIKGFPLSNTAGSVLPFILWAISIVVTILAYFGALLFLCTIEIDSRINYVFEPCVSTVAAILGSVFGGPLFVHANMIVALKFQATLESTVSTFFAAQVAILLYVYFVRPSIIRRLENHDLAASATAQPKLLIGGKVFSPSRMRYIKSENQYVHIYTDFDDTLLLGAIKEVAEQLDEQIGMIVHRSYYVMRRDVLRIEKDGAQRTLILSDDTRIPLARRRAAAVEAWFNDE